VGPKGEVGEPRKVTPEHPLRQVGGDSRLRSRWSMARVDLSFWVRRRVLRAVKGGSCE
jgi:hypothetical protein